MTHFEKKFLELPSKRLKLSLFLTKTKNEVDLTAKENHFNLLYSATSLGKKSKKKKIRDFFCKNENFFRESF